MISRDSLKGITSVIAVGLAIFQIYFTAGFGIIDSQLLRTIHLGIVLALVFLYFPPKKLQEGEREHPGWLALDLVLICGAFATAYFLASDIDYYMERIRYVDPVFGRGNRLRDRRRPARAGSDAPGGGVAAGHRGERVPCLRPWRAVSARHPPARRRHLQDALRTAVSRDRRAVRHSAGGVLHHDLRLRHVRVLPPAGGIGAGLSGSRLRA